jgi:hypothetical protein
MNNEVYYEAVSYGFDPDYDPVPEDDWDYNDF